MNAAYCLEFLRKTRKNVRGQDLLDLWQLIGMPCPPSVTASKLKTQADDFPFHHLWNLGHNGAHRWAARAKARLDAVPLAYDLDLSQPPPPELRPHGGAGPYNPNPIPPPPLIMGGA